jgi:hypothetical protein
MGCTYTAWKIIKKSFVLVIISVLLIGLIPQPKATAMSEEQKRIFDLGISYFDAQSCDASDNGQTNSSTSATGGGFPNIDPSNLSNAIDKWIAQQNPNSELKGLGSTIVASAKHADVNPLLIVAIARQESGLSDPVDYNVKYANNSFGRTATASQPHYQGTNLWYKWSSVKASVDYTASENENISGGGDIASYLQNQFGDKLKSEDMYAVFLEGYAPKTENDTAAYIKNVKSWIDELIGLAGGSAAGSTVNLGCCPPDSGSSTTLSGKNNAEKVWNFFIGQGLNNLQVAAIMGNLQQESGFSPTIVNNSSGAYGIGQWLGGRLTSLKSKPDSDNLVTQLNFMWDELNSSSYKSSVLEPLKKATDLKEAVDIWLEHYEIPCSPGHCDNELKVRFGFATTWKRGGDSGGNSTSPATTSDVQSPSSGCGSSGSIDGYKNPYRDVKQQTPMRIDMGVDYGGIGPIYAIGNGKVNRVYKRNGGSGWPGWGVDGAGGWVSYTLSDGPAKGKTVYFAENCNPAVKEGDTVTPDTKICDLDGLTSAWSESGWAADKTTSWAAAHTEWAGHDSTAYYTAYGENFSDLLEKLGQKPGTKQAGAQKLGSLPSGWPTWK